MGGNQHQHFGGAPYGDRDTGPVSGAIVRPALAGGLAFMDAAANTGFCIRELAAWIEHRLVQPGFMPMPSTVHEPDVGSVSLTQSADAWTVSIEARGARIVAAARARVTATLRGLVALPADDRFLSANIFAGRVERATTDRGTHWHPRLRGNERLSDLVLALFAADILGHREDYEHRLYVCEDCGRMCFGPTATVESHCERRA